MEKTIRVLVVDDERVIRDGCERVLKNQGFNIITAENGQIALDILASQDLDIMLVDLKMPVLGGEEVLEICRKKYPNIPIIIITGHGTVDAAVECMKKGAYDFITKPFQIDQFLMTITRAIEKRKLERKATQFQIENRRNLYDLQLEKSRVRTIIAHMANGVMVTNRSLEVVLHNGALMRLLEVPSELTNPFPITAIMNNKLFIDSLRKIQSRKAPADETISQEIAVANNILRALSASVLDQDNNFMGTVTVIENITTFKELDQMKSDFANLVAHELRSPLVSIRQINSVLLEGLAEPLNPKQHNLIDRCTKKIDALIELINDLLDVAKIEAAKNIQHMVPIDIGLIIQEIIELISARAQKQNIILEYNIQSLKPVRADQKQMEELFHNLISNAINYSPDGGKIIINAKRLGEYIEIKIKDTGVGIPVEEMPKIFNKFYRIKHPKTRQVMGTGLGLSIVKGIVDSHYGSIDVKSIEDHGTTFRVLLPVIS